MRPFLGGSIFNMNIHFSTIAWGIDSDYPEARKMIVNQPKQWVQLWQLHTAYDEPPPPVPKVDFNRYRVLAVFAGEKPTGGYSVDILSVEAGSSQSKEQTSLLVTIKFCQPEEDEMVTEALTYPYHIIQIPKIHGSKVFFRCSQCSTRINTN